MEIEFFCHPDESMKWYEYWRDVRKKWYSTLGIKSDNLRPREQGKEELAHYSIGTTDIEYMFPFSDEPQELEGVAHRGAYDLTAAREAQRQGPQLLRRGSAGTRDKAGREHQLVQGVDEDEPAGGGGRRSTSSCRTSSSRRPGRTASRWRSCARRTPRTRCRRRRGTWKSGIVMQFHPRLAPIKAAIFPLVNKDGMPEKARRSSTAS